MPEEFRQRIINDILKADNDIIALLSFRDKLKRVVLGEDVLSDVEVVELAYRLKQPIKEYMSRGIERDCHSQISP